MCTSEPKTKEVLLHPGRQRSMMVSTVLGSMGGEGGGEGSPASVSTRKASGCRRRGGGRGDEGGDARWGGDRGGDGGGGGDGSLGGAGVVTRIKGKRGSRAMLDGEGSSD